MARLVFVGSKDLGLSALQVLIRRCLDQLVAVVTIDDSADERSRLNAIVQLTASHGIPCRILRKPCEQKAAFDMFAPTVAVVVGWYWILPAEILRIAPDGFVGCHASLLPKYRGNAPLVWAIMRGDRSLGVTMFYFDNGMDSGDIIGQAEFDCPSDWTIADALAEVEASILELVERHIDAIVAGRAPRQAQNHAAATYTSLRTEADGRIDWNQSAGRLHDFVRAQTRPYPGAFAFTPEGQKLRIWRAEPFPYPFFGVPGRICQRHDGGTVVACGTGALVILESTIDNVSGEAANCVLRWGEKLA